jgi:tetratricopeptide (TPR) repeat protein
MKVAYRLRRRPTPEPATALLLPSHQVEDLARLCAHLGHDPLPPVYLVADGFLLKLRQPPTQALGGVVRLRGLADNLLLPVDGDLAPALLPDEAAALVSRRGLVFLPGGRVLEYDPAAPLAPSAWLGVAGLRRGDWQPLPAPPPLAERLTEITLDLPGESPDELLEAGGEGIGTEAPRPEDAGLPSKILSKTAFTAGKGLSWLGRKLGLGGLARAGNKWMESALNLWPRLSEAVLGRQEASLRDLLKDFREGNIERALRRAIPLSGNDRGAVPATGSQLPTQDTRYSLKDLLRSGQGGGGVWLSSYDTWRELEREYRRLAEQATQAGDYRRAAFIYGKLLGDYRQAAAVLARNGLHRDAAILYLKKVGDTLAAAREYEAAGDVDQALALYRQRGEHALAGDLLRRAGEEELAVAEYRLAADRLLTSDAGYYQAGELLRTRAGRTDLALPYYQTGWAQRPAGSPVPCAVRLAQHYAEEASAAKLLALTEEADRYLEPPGNDSLAASFFNEVAGLADRPALAAARDDLRDRALLALAGKLRQRVQAEANPGALVSTLLGTSALWAPAVVSDAQHAVRGPARLSAPPAPRPVARTTIRAWVARVTAAVQATGSGDIFLGFESGEVFCFRPASGEAALLVVELGPVLGLAASDDGAHVAVLSRTSTQEAMLRSFLRDQPTAVQASRPVPACEQTWLCPLLAGDGPDKLLRLGIEDELHLFTSPGVLLLERHKIPTDGPPPWAFLLLTALGVSYAEMGRWQTNWEPALPAASTLNNPPLAWLRKGPACLELAGVSAHGHSVAWFNLDFPQAGFARVASGPHSGGPFRAATLVRPGLVAAVTSKDVRWLRASPRGLSCEHTTPADLPEAVACFPHYPGDELIVVCADGTVARVPGLRR